MFSYGPPHMAEQKLGNQLRPTYRSSVRIRDIALRTCQKWWTIGKSGERESGISMLVARQDDHDYIYIYIYIYIYLLTYYLLAFTVTRKKKKKRQNLEITISWITAWGEKGKKFWGGKKKEKANFITPVEKNQEICSQLVKRTKTHHKMLQSYNYK